MSRRRRRSRHSTPTINDAFEMIELIRKPTEKKPEVISWKGARAENVIYCRDCELFVAVPRNYGGTQCPKHSETTA